MYSFAERGDSTSTIMSKTSDTAAVIGFEKEAKPTGLKARVDIDRTNAGTNVCVGITKNIENAKQASSSLVKATPVASTSAERRMPAAIQENDKENVPFASPDV
jgi:hypothetical protein